MSYKVLARKWRPQTFADVVGQKHVLTALTNGLLLDRIHHAYLLSGTRGVGKTTIARLLAKGLNCEKGITTIPCCQCKNCSEIAQSCFVDLIEIDAASRTKVEDTRELLDNVQYAPTHGRFKVYLIDEVHMLSRYSFNALLKTLEEPPAHVKFLLATTDPQKIPMTILSRCLQFHLKALNVSQISNQLIHILQNEHIYAEQRALELLARAADGSMRDALSLTDQAIIMGQGIVSWEAVSIMLGHMNTEQSLTLIEALVNANSKTMMEELAQCAVRSINWENLLVEMLSLLHRIAMGQLRSEQLNYDNQMDHLLPRLRNLARRITPEDLQLYYQTLLIGRKELPYAPDSRMGVEMTMLRALAFHPNKTLSSVHDTSASVEKIINQSPFDHTLSGLTTICDTRRMDMDIAEKIENDDMSAKCLQARTALLQHQERHKSNHSQSVSSNTLERRTSVYEYLDQRHNAKDCTLRKNNDTKPLELVAKLIQESIKRDPWSAQVQRLSLPKIVQQLALNAWQENIAPGKICLHLRSSRRYLKSVDAHNTLRNALSVDLGTQIELTILEDDNLEVKTPLELRQAIYEEKLIQAREAITTDRHIQMMQHILDAQLDEDSIEPI
ncbi:DNA polymerase III subunit gamma/tau [Candidatus Palibaumannia cicadellinicola]|uniref:DNA polymerase III subunit gamma/tau n=1 Tax=Candidatus Palibaumannia cicadellinicola TaxID=186490 RepID=A0A088MXT7_9GAMM|nr:DNA polymerase III subunit gamma/tau [Candidatus Baumannia cicadellinicola]AIN47019.1 DNA polymerase III subunits gamma and tau [Candidatus Baumannia cicadellinicola]